MSLQDYIQNQIITGNFDETDLYFLKVMHQVDLQYNTYYSPLDQYRHDGSEMPGGDIVENGGSNRDPGFPR